MANENASELRPTNEGLDLVVRWDAARTRLARAMEGLVEQREEYDKAKTELARWLAPSGFPSGVRFCVPVEDCFVEVHVENNELLVHWRNDRVPMQIAERSSRCR